MWGDVGGGRRGQKTVLGMQCWFTWRCSVDARSGRLLRGYSRSSSDARLTAARRLLTLSLR